MKKIFKFIYILIFVIILFGCNINNNENINNQDLKVYFINVGQADCSLIILPNGENILIDAGLDHATCYDENNFPSWNNIVNIFTMENIKTINHIIITHSHLDHYYYISDIIKNYDVKQIYVSGSTSTNYTYLDLLLTIDEYNIPMNEVYMGQKIINNNDITFQVLYTLKQDNPEDANKCSIITKLTYNKRSFLFMGDAGSKENDGEEILLKINADIKSDVLKVGHHGSIYGSSRPFLMKVLPEYAVITTSNITTTGHPHKSCMDRLRYYCQNILQSKDDGTILFSTNGESLSVKTNIGG